ncbi:MAG: hypothetical protein U0X39_14470 [Bacteroidales bacterium]
MVENILYISTTYKLTVNMRFPAIFFLLIITLFIASCSKDDNSSSGVVIKGKLPFGGIKKSADLYSSGSGYSLADTKSIMVFNSSGGYELFDISSSDFSVRAMQGTATALVFLGPENAFIGCLQAGGLNVLPLVSLKDGDNTVINLDMLTLQGTNVIPSSNPIGNEIDLNQDEIDRFRQFGAFFESLSQNIDADANGIPDLVEDKALFLSTMFDIYCGKWGLNNTPPQVIDTTNLHINHGLRVFGKKGIAPSDHIYTLTGPEGAPYNDISVSHNTDAPDGFIAFFRRDAPAPPGYPYGSIFLPFANGKYTLTLDNKPYSLVYSKVDAMYYFVLALPTVHTNNNNEITSVTIEYRDLKGRTIDPENFVYQTMVQLNAGATQIDQIGTMWESPESKTNTELYNFVPKVKIIESNVSGINVNYLDMVGNSYTINFKR